MARKAGDPSGWWGQLIRSDRKRQWWRLRYKRNATHQFLRMRAITLAQAFQSADGLIDLVDLDVQGAEADVLTAGSGELDRVRRVHVGTHNHDVEERIRELFTGLGWDCRTDCPCDTTIVETWWGGRAVYFQDGVQSWRNPRL